MPVARSGVGANVGKRDPIVGRLVRARLLRDEQEHATLPPTCDTS